jgi:hypothetical protein
VLGSSVPAIGSRVTFYRTDVPPSAKRPRACYVTVLT